MTFRRPKTKYNASKQHSSLIGRRFDSQAECRYAEHLWAREQNGEIRDLQFQVRVQLCPLVWLKVDFAYFDPSVTRNSAAGEFIWDEFKGFPTPAWKVKRNVWAAGLGPGMLRVTTERNRTHIERYYHTDIWPEKEKTP